METENQKPKVGVGVMIWKEGKILLGKRRWRHGDGEYAFPGGHLDYLESIAKCTEREVLEEVGIKIKNIKFLCLANAKLYLPRHDIYIGVSAEWESGEPQSFEEERMTDWEWYSLDNLPSPLFKFCNFSLEAYKTGHNYFDMEE